MTALNLSWSVKVTLKSYQPRKKALKLPLLSFQKVYTLSQTNPLMKIMVQTNLTSLKKKKARTYQSQHVCQLLQNQAAFRSLWVTWSTMEWCTFSRAIKNHWMRIKKNSLSSSIFKTTEIVKLPQKKLLKGINQAFKRFNPT